MHWLRFSRPEARRSTLGILLSFFHSNPVSSIIRCSVSYAQPMESRILWSSSGSTPAKPTRTLALPTIRKIGSRALRRPNINIFVPATPSNSLSRPSGNLRLLFLAPPKVLESLALRFLISRHLVSGTADQTESAADIPVTR